jgi:DNA-binding beta-propeller fold protein YncE
MLTHAATLLLTWPLAAVPATQGFRLEYVHNLATPAGDVRSSGLHLSYDAASRELYATGYGLVRVFNEAAMETFRFGDDQGLGVVQGVAPLEGGDLLVLASQDGRPVIRRCNFRGEVLADVRITGLPERLAAGFAPTAIARAGGRVYLADQQDMQVVAIDTDGRTLADYDLAEALELKGRQDQGLSGFTVDGEGNMLFTVPPVFRAFLVTPEGRVTPFGKAGSAPGNFGVAVGVARDQDGRFYVVDALKCAVIVFDRELRFLGEFGYRGRQPGQLIGPSSIVVGPRQVFVSQGADRGVAVYRIREE